VDATALLTLPTLAECAIVGLAAYAYSRRLQAQQRRAQADVRNS